VTAAGETVLDLLDALVRIGSVNPGLAPTDPAGAGEARIAAFVGEWGRRAGLRVTELQGTPGRPSVILRGGRDQGGAGCCCAATLTRSGWPAAPRPSRLASRVTASTRAGPTT
jgi:acetylornithine deacetylase/succinyl-diaminopimelate desuccinylase-like protein